MAHLHDNRAEAYDGVKEEGAAILSGKTVQGIETQRVLCSQAFKTGRQVSEAARIGDNMRVRPSSF